ncbi:FHA domain-containing protein [Bifidobacterium sp. UMB6791A]|nr:FHA domain-containing protein [Bifidobacterium sp. UMB6791B]MDK8248732.1 FHA domain-containing protein [Bifidobacterium sp. UMB6794B]MDK8635317.1 FHA domain-containing protein [Bifidobacterium sp. UMB6791A]
MSVQQTLQRWMITVGGVEQARVGAGQSVEIGRKPIRPLREDGFIRVDVVDNKRSMSKRHALFIVDASGAATIRDLNSTNGTYLVSESGDLLRLDPGVDFHMPDSIVRMQFGDVPVDFVRIEEKAPQGSDASAQPVRDLFSYAPDNDIKEPDAADLSVDDILDIRAGEPTGVFHAQSVSRPDLVWDSQKRLNDAAAADDLGSASAADAGADSDDNSTSAATSAVPSSATSSVEDVASVIDAASVAESVAEQIKPVIAGQVVLPVVRDEFASPVEPRNLFDDAANNDAASDSSNSDLSNSDLSNSDLSNSDLSNSNYATNSQNVESQADSKEDYKEDLQASVQSDMQDVAQDQSVAQGVAQNYAQEEVQYNDSADAVNSVNDANDVSDASAAIASDSAQFTPAFEPGSVFEKVSNGEFSARKEVVSAGGFTSEEAQKTDDFAEQFEMAKYQELLPFLAMNTNLYDDLYAWLSAQGNADVDQALAQNSGYSAYRNAIGL